MISRQSDRMVWCSYGSRGGWLQLGGLRRPWWSWDLNDEKKPTKQGSSGSSSRRWQHNTKGPEAGACLAFSRTKMNLVKEGNLPEAEVMEVHKDQIGGYFKDWDEEIEFYSICSGKPLEELKWGISWGNSHIIRAPLENTLEGGEEGNEGGQILRLLQWGRRVMMCVDGGKCMDAGEVLEVESVMVADGSHVCLWRGKVDWKGGIEHVLSIFVLSGQVDRGALCLYNYRLLKCFFFFFSYNKGLAFAK